MTTTSQTNGGNGLENQGRKISKEYVASLPLVSYKQQIVLVDSLDKVAKAMKYLNTQTVLGFDTETRPAFKKGQRNKVALLQIASEEKCFLFRLNIIGFPEELIELLSNKKILKIGLSLKDDYMTMRRLANFEPDGFVELQNFVKDYDIAEASLQKIFALLFGQKISKSQRLSNWEATQLTEAQKKYAATDAWACLKIYNFLIP